MRSQKAEAGTATFQIRAGIRQGVLGSGKDSHARTGNSPPVAVRSLGLIPSHSLRRELALAPIVPFPCRLNILSCIRC